MRPEHYVIDILAQICQISEKETTELFHKKNIYSFIEIRKKSGGIRILNEPHPDVKKAQRRILRWLYNLHKRASLWLYTKSADRYAHYQKPAIVHEIEYQQESLFDILQPVHSQLFGGVCNRSTRQAASRVCNGVGYFVIKTDLKDAYPSITQEIVAETLHSLLYWEMRSYVAGYRQRILLRDLKKDSHKTEGNPDDSEFIIGFIDSLLYSVFSGEPTEGMLARRSNLFSYVNFPLFSSNKFPRLRQKIREAINCDQDTTYQWMDEVAGLLAESIASLVTFQGTLPQGAPTSGFILALVLSRRGGLAKRILKPYSFGYVDDFMFRTGKKPNSITVRNLMDRIAETGFLEANYKKSGWYDVRNGAVPILGMHLIRRKATKKELAMIDEWDCGRPVYAQNYERPSYLIKSRGFIKAMRNNRDWYVYQLVLPRKTQNFYRGFLYAVIKNKSSVDDSTYQKALGYYGHIVDVYGGDHKYMPSSLRKVVIRFRVAFKLRRWSYKPEFLVKYLGS